MVIRCDSSRYVSSPMDFSGVATPFAGTERGCKEVECQLSCQADSL
jgi:hypothetical protein